MHRGSGDDHPLLLRVHRQRWPGWEQAVGRSMRFSLVSVVVVVTTGRWLGVDPNFNLTVPSHALALVAGRTDDAWHVKCITVGVAFGTRIGVPSSFVFTPKTEG